MKKLFIPVFTAWLALSFLTGVASNSAAAAGKVIKLGVTGEDHRIWDVIQKKLVQENIDLQIISFADYVRPNLALADKEIDLNAFQHYAYFNKFKADRKLKITVIAETVLAPMGIYSHKLKSLESLKPGAKIAVPNDATNEGRALYLLQSAGLLTIKPEAGLLPTLKDIAENPKKLQIIELVATQIPRSLPDVDLAVINSGVAIDAKFSPVKDAIYLEDASLESSKPYINVIAAREEERANPLYAKVVEAYHSAEVKQVILDIYQGALIPAF